MRAGIALVARQFVLVAGAILAYFGVRGLTEGNVALAHDNASRVLRFERWVGLDLERGLQNLIADHQTLVTIANWVYIWMHWPVVIATLVWLLLAHRDDYTELRNAMFISGAIGLVIFATFPVAPPRLFSPEYIDTVTQRSHSYRVLQPPGLVNKYAAVPSLHFGWNLLVGLTWARIGRTPPWLIAAVAMPIAMGWAVVATANHWVLDVLLGGSIALIGLAIERGRHRVRAGRRDDGPSVELGDNDLVRPAPPGGAGRLTPGDEVTHPPRGEPD